MALSLRSVARGTTFEESSRLDPDTYAAHGGALSDCHVRKYP